MRNPKEAARWLVQAEHNLRVAKAHLRNRFWSDACFMAEQTAQVAMKAFLYGAGKRYVPVHSVQELARMCGLEDRAFQAFVRAGKILDRYYIPTRYPDALAPPAVPADSFLEEEARRAVEMAEKILRRAKERPRRRASSFKN